jgi:hypothetical protein
VAGWQSGRPLPVNDGLSIAELGNVADHPLGVGVLVVKEDDSDFVHARGSGPLIG